MAAGACPPRRLNGHFYLAAFMGIVYWILIILVIAALLKYLLTGSNRK